MARLARLAVGTVQSGAEGQAILWALMEGLRREEVQVQSFLSRACFPAYQGAAAVTGLAPRHLDSWLMSPQTCRELFAHGARAADLALVEGEFNSSADGQSDGGQLEPLCQWLMVLGIIALCQPWVEVLHRYGVTIILVGLVGFSIFSKIKPGPVKE